MDALLRRIERRARGEPGDRAEALAHARELARAGLAERARAEVRAQMGSRRIDNEGLALLRDLATQRGTLWSAPWEVAPRAQIDLMVRGTISGGDGLGELAPVVAFVGPIRAESWRSVGRLLKLFGDSPEPRSCELVRSHVAWGEHVVDFRVPLRACWPVSPGFDAKSLRLLSLPGDPSSGKFRRRSLRSVSALAVVVPEGATDGELRTLTAALERDLRCATGAGLAELPLLFQYADPADAAGHTRRLAHLGLARASWAVVEAGEGGDAGLADALALLLLDVSRSAQALVRPRGSG